MNIDTPTDKVPCQLTLDSYAATWAEGVLPYAGHNLAEERQRVTLFYRLLADLENPFDRASQPGHFTASALITDRSLTKVLLTHHRKLDMWLQLGGHADGDHLLERVALKEAEEESGLHGMNFLAYEDQCGLAVGNRMLPFDLDRHLIPCRGQEPEHYHYDVRFLIEADPDQPVRVSEESHDVRWFCIDEALQVTQEPSMIRQFDKLAAIRHRLN